MIRIAVLTTTRAEYGLMRQLLFRMISDDEIQLSLLVSGTHLSEKFGMTVNEIKEDDIPIEQCIDILCEENGSINVSKTMSNAITRFAEYFAKKEYDYLLVDGDRYETLAVCIAAVNSNISVIHCGGGATTAGASDEYWRHAITKLSYIHFPTMEKYRRRIIRMGENPDRVYTVGSMGIENILVMPMLSKGELEERVKLKLDKPYAMVTFHPATLDHESYRKQVEELLQACDKTENMKFVFSKTNADNGGQIINECIENYVRKNAGKAVCVASLGAKYYLTALKYCNFVMGNSSSGLIEAPSFGIPTINIGDRQLGREQAESVINCRPECDDIIRAIEKARTQEFKEVCKNVINPNGDGHTSERIIKYIKEIYARGNTTIQKVFYDVEQ